MFKLFRAEDRLVIQAGRVWCPVRERDTDLETCLKCDWVREVDLDATHPFVRCRPPRKLLLVP